MVCNRHAGPYTPNKDWPSSHWDELSSRLSGSCTLVEIGNPDPLAQQPSGPHYIDLRGKTTVRDLVAVMASADLHVGPISGPVHIAAAMGIPAVVILGGFETPGSSSYPDNINLYSPLACSPCWLTTPCPYEKKCLTMIQPEKVMEAIWKLWNSRAGREQTVR